MKRDPLRMLAPCCCSSFTMEIRVPTLTPRNYRPRGDLSRLSNLHVPHLDYKTQFFLDVRPEFWTYEGFLQQTPGSRDGFLYDLDLLGKATTHGPDARRMRIHCKRLAEFYKTAEGQVILDAIRNQFRAAVRTQLGRLQAAIAGLGVEGQQQQEQQTQQRQEQEQQQELHLHQLLQLLEDTEEPQQQQ
ncbi:hypothetical protein B0O80DRAFT_534253 [Mortierella sp. GBAus27b]|nr:hypothetical protein B0O80DRAFT_534253 [Mortierella sp. GBAus27b]